MKRRKLIRLLKKEGCFSLREGKKHTVFYNPLKRKVSTIPRHTEIADTLVKKICKDLDITLLK